MRGLFAHRRIRRAVEAYLDGELRPDARAQMARHLTLCWRCSVTAETLCLIKHALTRRRDRTPPSVAERRLQRFAKELVAGAGPSGVKLR